MTSASKLTSLFVAALAFTLSPCPASAAPAGDESELDSHTRTAARSLAAQGSAAFEAQRYAEALDLFERAAALVEVPTITLMQARTLVQLGRWVEAADKYASIQRWKEANEAAAAANPSFAQAVGAAQQELPPLMARIPKLNVKIVQIRSEAVEVYVAGRRLPPALVGVDVPVDPGLRDVEVRRPGKETIVRQVTLVEGRREAVTISLDVKPAEPVAVPVVTPVVMAPPAVPPKHESSSDETLGYVLLGSGAAGTVVGVLTGITALSAKSELDEACTPGCPPSHEETLSTYRLHRTLSYVGFGIGVVGVSLGGYILLSGT
jgi:tetratricopeptide (TPR) repeat protein